MSVNAMLHCITTYTLMAIRMRNDSIFLFLIKSTRLGIDPGTYCNELRCSTADLL